LKQLTPFVVGNGGRVEQSFGPIMAATVTVSNLERAVALYEGALFLEVGAQADVPSALARSWGAPAVTGRPCAVLRPGSGNPGWLRLVEAPPVPAYRPLASVSWAGIEILVADPVGLAGHLAKWPFKVIGPPAPLRSFPDITAMQVIDPDGAVLYLTDVGAAAQAIDLPVVSGQVDRVFIVVLAVPDFPRALAFYREHFGLEAGEAHERNIHFEGPGYGLPAPDSPANMTTMRLAGQSLIQVDEYPEKTPPRPAEDRGLPAGFAIASFAVASLVPFEERGLTPAMAGEGPPYEGRRTLTMRGPAGELIELIETGRSAG
jgi:catechol 2,3-dioxygenase-like lactoylglutathione lyase family enzyme